MPATYNALSKKYFNEVIEPTPENQDKLAEAYLGELAEKYTNEEIFLVWNSGRPTGCSKGVNKYGVPYDSCKYVESLKQKYSLIDGS
jgi:hypothetical protein